MNPEDKADKQIDHSLKMLERRLVEAYSQAQKELDNDFHDYLYGWTEDGVNASGEPIMVHHQGLHERYKEQFKAFEDGKWKDKDGNVITDQVEFNKWWYAQEMRGKLFEEKRDQMAQRMVDANLYAQDLINGKLPGAYSLSSNAVASLVQKSALEKGIVGVRFDLVDESTVRNLVTYKRNNFPFHLVKINKQKDTIWNTDKMDKCLLQGVLQGDSIGKLATRFQQAVNMNRASAVRNARTAMTAARNGGKQDRWDDLKKQGVTATKIWHATLDGREREWHNEADGQEVGQDEPFIVNGEELMFPGDTSLGATGSNIYNCRCTRKSGKIIFMKKGG